MAADRRYWDSNAFLGWLNEEPDKVAKCEGVLNAAEEGKIEIVTSALTLTEVIKLKGEKPIPRQKEELIRGFFEQPWIMVRQVDRFVAEDARGLIWAHGVKPKDAIHLATALRLKLSTFDTFDDELIALSEQLGNPKLVIAYPNLPHTPDMFPGTKPGPAAMSPRRRGKRLRTSR